MSDVPRPRLDPNRPPTTLHPGNTPKGWYQFARELESFAKRLEADSSPDGVQTVIHDLRLRAKMMHNKVRGAQARDVGRDTSE